MAMPTKAQLDAQEIASRQRTEVKDKLYVIVDEDNDRVIIGGVIALRLKMGAKIIILEDEFKSSYDCTRVWRSR